MPTRSINSTLLALFFLGATGSLSASAAEKAKKPVHVFSIEKAIAGAIQHGHADQLDKHDDEIINNKTRLDQLGIAQYRVSQSVRRIQGKPATPQLLQSPSHETDIILGLLDDGLAEIAARQQPDRKLYEKQKAQRANQKIMQATIPLYWRAVGVKTVDVKNRKLIEKTQTLLKPFIYSNTDSADRQKDQLLQLLAALKQIQSENDATITQLASKLGTDKANIDKRVFLPEKNLPIPFLSIAPEKVDARALAMLPLPVPVSMQDIEKYLAAITPGLTMKWLDSPNGDIMPWLSTGKNIAFDLYNSLDKLERKQLLKQEQKVREDMSYLLASATITRGRLAYSQYLTSLELFSLASCLNANTASLQSLEFNRLDESLDNQIRVIGLEKTRIEMVLQLYDQYARLQADFDQLTNSISKESFPEKLESRQTASIIQSVGNELKRLRLNKGKDIFSCYTSAQQKIARQQEIQQLITEKQQAQKQVNQLIAEKKALAAKKMKPVIKTDNAWLAKQNPRAWTIQILSHSNQAHLQKYSNRHNLGAQAKIIKTSYKGKTIYSLLYGLYKDKELAFIGQFKLPDAVQSENQVMLRRIADVQKNAKN